MCRKKWNRADDPGKNTHTVTTTSLFTKPSKTYTTEKITTLTNGAGGTEFPHAKEKNCTLTSQFT